MDLIQPIVGFVAKTSYDDLPAAAVETAKRLVIDTMGVALAGSSAPGINTVVDLVTGWGGKKEATILVNGKKVPAPAAALANCAMSRALDFDDAHEKGGGHLASSYIPSSFILAEYAKRPVSGKELVTAIVLGCDVGIRLRSALKDRLMGWPGETFAPFGVMAMAGKLLNLSKEQILNGMGIAYSQCSCNSQGVVDGALTVRLQQGLGTRAGMLAAMLAERGYTGCSNVLQGTYGLFTLYGRGQYDPAAITDELGKRFDVVNTSIKPYPCCKFTHVPLAGTAELVKEKGIKVEDIQHITIYTNRAAYDRCGVGDNKYHPGSIVNAQFSIPFTVASMLLKKNVFIDSFTTETIKDFRILDLAGKIESRIDPELAAMKEIVTPSRIEVETNDGRTYSTYVEYVKGHPKNPMTMSDCIEKFNKCARFSVKPIPEKNLAKFIDMAKDLEQVQDVPG